MANEVFFRQSDLLNAMVEAIKWWENQEDKRTIIELVESVPTANAYTAHEVAEILAEVTGDDCACDVHGNDEWLPEFCEFSQTVCPDPAGVACWEQYLKWREKRKEKQ